MPGGGRGERGLGMVELIIGLAISAMVMTVLGMTLTAVVRNTTANRDQQDATQQLRNAMFWLNQDTQSAVASLSSGSGASASLEWTDYSTGAAYESAYTVSGSELRRTYSVDGTPTTRTIARDIAPGGFAATKAGNSITYTITVLNGGSTQTRTETVTMRVPDEPQTPFATTTATDTPTVTPTNTSTPTPTNTNTPTATSTATPTSTGTNTPSATPTNTPTPTNTSTPTPTNTSTPTPTNTPTSTPTNTPTATPTSSTWLKTGSYTGNGNDDRTISGIGFQPDIVFVRHDGNSRGIVRTANMPSGDSKLAATTNNLAGDYIQSFTADGFVIGGEDDVNEDGETFYYVAMKTGANVSIGSYVGNGADSRSISGAGFQPDWVMTMGNGQQDRFRPALLAGDASYQFGGTGSNANRIQAILADGFEVGSHNNVNQNGRTYYWIAFDVTAKVVTGSYTGDSDDGRDITGLGLTPDFVWVKRINNRIGPWRTDAMPGDTSVYWNANNPTTNRIQDLITDGFELGDQQEVNQNNQTYYFLGLAP